MGTERNLESGLKFAKIEISGEALERGYQIGTKYKDHIGNFVRFMYKEFITNLGLPSEEKVLQHVAKYTPYIEDYSPEIAEEIKGIAKGAGRPYEEIVMLNMLEELIWPQGSERGHFRCTTFAATGRATESGEVYLGQTWDTDIETFENCKAQLIAVKRPSGPNFLTYTYPGVLASAGLNSNGIGICWNTVPTLELKVGVPTYIIVAEILRQKTIGDALTAILRAKRASCFNFVLADESEIYDVEATPSDVDIAYHDTYMGHANHFVSPKFRERQDLSAVGAWSIYRHNRINRILGEHCGHIDRSLCMNALRDHGNYPNSICRHPDPAESDPRENFITEAAWVMVPAKREMWISYGPPCQHEFERYLV